MKYTVAFGGWYQRTTLHLTEISDFLDRGDSRLDLNENKLRDLWRSLGIAKTTRKVKDLEYIQAQTSGAITIRYYEDGLYVLTLSSTDVKRAEKILSLYFYQTFEPAISYIFSLGAPTPKILANIKPNHPTVISYKSALHDKQDKKVNTYGKVYSKITSNKTTVYKTPSRIFITSKKTSIVRGLVEEQIFFREFKDQLEKYLNIHRSVWEEIATIKEKGSIRGNEVETMRNKLESYKKTIDLISNRINQMGACVGTRKNIAQGLKIEKDLLKLFQYKFDTLSDTHSYIRELWNMTSNYVESAIKILVEVENKIVNSSIKSLTLITTVGVLSGIMGYLAQDELPKLNQTGLAYFVFLVVATWVINNIVVKANKKRKYDLEFTERSKKI